MTFLEKLYTAEYLKEENTNLKSRVQRLEDSLTELCQQHNSEVTTMRQQHNQEYLYFIEHVTSAMTPEPVVLPDYTVSEDEVERVRKELAGDKPLRIVQSAADIMDGARERHLRAYNAAQAEAKVSSDNLSLTAKQRLSRRAVQLTAQETKEGNQE